MCVYILYARCEQIFLIKLFEREKQLELVCKTFYGWTPNC